MPVLIWLSIWYVTGGVAGNLCELLNLNRNTNTMHDRQSHRMTIYSEMVNHCLSTHFETVKLTYFISKIWNNLRSWDKGWKSRLQAGINTQRMNNAVGVLECCDSKTMSSVNYLATIVILCGQIYKLHQHPAPINIIFWLFIHIDCF